MGTGAGKLCVQVTAPQTGCRSSPHVCVCPRVHLPPTCQLSTGRMPPPKVHRGVGCVCSGCYRRMGPMVDSTRWTLCPQVQRLDAHGAGTISAC